MLDYLFNEAARRRRRRRDRHGPSRTPECPANTLAKSYEQTFREFEGDIDPTSREGPAT
jgi:hypothetical protein